MLHSQEAGVTQSGQLLHPSFQRVDDLVFLEFLILIDHLLIKHKHRHLLNIKHKLLASMNISFWVALAAWQYNHLFC